MNVANKYFIRKEDVSMKKLSKEEMILVEGGKFCDCVCEPRMNLAFCRIHAKRMKHTYDYVAAQSQNKNGTWTIVYAYTP